MTVAGSPQRIGLKVRLARVAFPVFRLLVFISHWNHLQNATARNAVENPVVNQAALRAGKIISPAVSRFQRGQHCCQRGNNNTAKIGLNWPFGGNWMLGTSFLMLGAGYWMLTADYFLLGAGFEMLDAKNKA
jgi:hypothetical protein